MTEEQAYSTLVIILSIALAVFLLLAIIAAIYLLKILRRINRISEKAETVADNLEQAADNFKKVAGPAAAMQAFANLFKR